MISPSSRLLYWFAWVALPASLLVVIDPEWLGAALALLSALAAVLVVDAVRVIGRFQGVSLELPKVVRCTQGRRALLPVRLQLGVFPLSKVRVAIALPEGAESLVEELWAEFPPGVTAICFDWSFEPSQRGRSAIGNARLGMVSPLGLWEYRVELSTDAELRVYPSLRQDRRALAALFLNRGTVGIHARRQLGQGREFEKLREYVPGDGFQEIHWKATAKRGYPVTKVFQLERTQEVYVVIDCSRLSARPVQGGVGEAAIERFIAAAMVLGQAAQHQGDLFGMVVVSDRVERFVRAGTGMAHFHVCRDALFQLQTRDVSPDFDELATFLRTRLRRRALLLYLTALDDPILSEAFLRHAEWVSQHHLMWVCMLKAPGMRPIFDREDVQTVEEVYERLGGHLRWQKLREQTRVLRRHGVEMKLVDPSSLSLELVSRYTSVKQRQAL